jgi:hypothetical protein
MSLLATVVDTKALGDAVLWGLIAGVGVTTIFTVAVISATRFGDNRRAQRLPAAALNGALAILALAAFVLAIVYGIALMTEK